MSTTALKEKLIGQIRLTNDASILAAVSRVLALETSIGEIYQLSSLEKQEIEQGRMDIEAGRIQSDDEVQKEIEEWLNM